MDGKIISSVLSLALEDYIDARLLIRQDRLLNGGHLSALAVEKLLKGLILAYDMQPKHVHLDKVDKLINQVSKTIPNIQNYINVDFLHYLGRIFSMRYFPEQNDDHISISRNKLLWELDRLFDQVHGYMRFEPSAEAQHMIIYTTEKNLNNPLIYERNQWLSGKHSIAELEALPDFIFATARLPIGMSVTVHKEFPKTFINCKLGEELKIEVGKK